MMKIRFYNTPNSWWYVGTEYKKRHWFSISFLTKKVTLYWGENTKFIPQPKQKWSEGDEEQFSFCCAAIELSNYSSDENRNYAISFLESLKDRVQPQNTWKPSESDILLLERIANGKSNPQDFQASLGGLIGQLKKLMEK